jgi:flagellar basal body-associated protein FliL
MFIIIIILLVVVILITAIVVIVIVMVKKLNVVKAVMYVSATRLNSDVVLIATLYKTTALLDVLSDLTPTTTNYATGLPQNVESDQERACQVISSVRAPDAE